MIRALTLLALTAGLSLSAAAEATRELPTADTAATLSPQSASVLASPDVHLQRTAFSRSGLDDRWDNALHAAAQGDAEAALRLAHAYHPQFGVTPNRFRYVGWLEFAAGLGSREASYELAVHFRSSGQAAQAAVYQTRAVALGYVLPSVLDNVRK